MILKGLTNILLGAVLTVSANTQKVKVAIISELPDSDIDSPKYLKDILPACQLALKEMQGRLKRANVEVELNYHPFKFGPISPFETLKKITQTDAIGAVGFQTSDEVMKAAPAIAGSDFIAVSPYASASKILNLAPNYLSLTANSGEQAKLIEHFINHDLHGLRTAAIVAWDSPFSKDFYESLSDNFKTRITLFKVWDSLADFEDRVGEIIKLKPDVVLLPNFPVNSASVIKILSKAGLHPVFIGPDSWGENSDQRFGKIVAGEKFTGYTFRQFSILRPGSEVKHFAEQLRQRGATYSVVAGLYHDATRYLLELIANSQKPITRAGLLQLSKTTRTVTGVMGRNCISKAVCKGRKYVILRATDKGFQVDRTYEVPK